jgi:hypothetical protein
MSTSANLVKLVVNAFQKQANAKSKQQHNKHAKSSTTLDISWLAMEILSSRSTS